MHTSGFLASHQVKTYGTKGGLSSSCEMIILHNNSHGGIDRGLYENIYDRSKE